MLIGKNRGRAQRSRRDGEGRMRSEGSELDAELELRTRELRTQRSPPALRAYLAQSSPAKVS